MENNNKMEEEQAEAKAATEKKTVRDHLYSRIDYPLSSIDRFIKVLLILLLVSIILGVIM